MKKKTLISIALILVVAMMAVVLSACVPGDIEKGKAKMEKAGYEAKITEYGSLAQAASSFAGYDGIKASLVAMKASSEDGLYALYFDDKDNAEKAYNKVSETYKDEDDVEVGKSGSVVYYGTKEAVKAFKK